MFDPLTRLTETRPSGEGPPAAEVDAGRSLREAVGVGVFVLLAYLLLRISPYLTLGALSDDGIYVALGRAISQGDGYRSIYAVGDPVHAKYPPGLPLVYAVFWWVSAQLSRVHAMALFSSAVASACAAGLIWWTGRVRFGAALLPLLVLAIGPFFVETSVQYLNLAVSEPWFLLGWAVALAMVPWAIEGPRRRAFLLGLLLAGTALFRSQALFLIPAFALAVAIEKGWRKATILLVGSAAPLLVWRIWHGWMLRMGPGTTQPDEMPYGTWFPSGSIIEQIRYFVAVMGFNAKEYARILPDHLSRPVVLGWIVLALLLGQAVVAAARRPRVVSPLALTLLAQVALLAVWPFAQDRFYVPLLPMAGLLAASSGAWGRPGRQRQIGVAVLMAVVLVVGVRQQRIRAGTFVAGDETVRYHASRYLVANSMALLTAGNWIERNARPDDRILAPFAASLFLYTGRKTVNAEPAQPQVGPSVFERRGAFLAGRVRADSVTILLLGGTDFGILRDAAEVQARCPEVLEFLGSVIAPAQMAAYRIHPDDCLFSFLEP
jgi:hypothetical protein